MEINAVDVVFKTISKPYTFNSYAFNIKKGEKVVVETVQGLELATAYNDSHKLTVENEEEKEKIKPILRRATKKDLEKFDSILEKEKKYKKEIQKIVEKFNLEMKVVSVEITLDEAKILVNFTAENRVDFRELVKELASTYKAKIELRQIGARDETKIVGGIGPCGHICCCNRFLNDFEHVSIKMAKTQNLSLNPSKISGLCGRLMCCLAFENEHYEETSKLMPKINSEVETPDGKAIVTYNNILTRKVEVKMEVKEGEPVELREYDVADLKFQKTKKPDNNKKNNNDNNDNNKKELE